MLFLIEFKDSVKTRYEQAKHLSHLLNIYKTKKMLYSHINNSKALKKQVYYLFSQIKHYICIPLQHLTILD